MRTRAKRPTKPKAPAFGYQEIATWCPGIVTVSLQIMGDVFKMEKCHRERLFDFVDEINCESEL